MLHRHLLPEGNYRRTRVALVMGVALSASSLHAMGQVPEADREYHVTSGPPPVDLAAGFKDADLVLRGRVLSAKSEDYPMPTARGRAFPVPTTAYSVKVLEKYQDVKGALAGRTEMMLRRMGYLPSSGRGQIVAGFPEIRPGNEYVFFANISQRGAAWLLFGPDGVYYRDEGGKVATSGVGNIARENRGTNWPAFLQRLRDESRKVAR